MAERNTSDRISDWSRFLLAVLISLLDSAFTHGYHLGCMRGMKGALNDWLLPKGFNKESIPTNNSISQHEKTNHPISFFTILDSIYALGGALGCCFIVFFANKFGRRGGMLMTSFISVFACLFGGYSKHFDSLTLLIISRILSGVKQGINSGLGPMYLIEISPQKVRGHIGTLYGLVFSFGRFLGEKSGKKFGNKFHWPLVLSLPVIPAIIQLMVLPLCPESPKYLFVIKRNEWQSRKALKWLRGSSYKEQEVSQLRDEGYQYRAIGTITFRMIFRNYILLNAFIATVILTSSQQLCGVTILLLYVKEHLVDDKLKIHYFTVKVIPAVVMLFIVERFRRRSVYLFSYFGMTISSLILFLLFEVLYQHYPLNETVIFIFGAVYLTSYKVGCGTLTWFCASELMNTSGAPIGYAVGSAANWFFKFCIIGIAVPFASLLHGYTFINFAFTNFAFLYYVYTRVPETSNKSIKEVYKDLHLKIKN